MFVGDCYFVTFTFVIATLASSVTLQFEGRQSLISLETTGVGRLRSSGLSAISLLDVVNINTQIISPDPVVLLQGWLVNGWLSSECCSFYKQNIEVWFGYRLHTMTDNTTTTVVSM